MSKFYGNVGFGVTEETAPGVWKEKITPRPYYGDMVRNTRKLQGNSEQLNDDINISNELSIIADPYAYQNFHTIRFVEFMGAKWKVTDVTVEYPRLKLTLGGVFNDGSD